MARYIDADAFEARLADFVDWCKDERFEGAKFVLTWMLPDAPTADVREIVHGEFVRRERIPHCEVIECTACRKVYDVFRASVLTNFCPNCGAQMDGGTE